MNGRGSVSTVMRRTTGLWSDIGTMTEENWTRVRNNRLGDMTEDDWIVCPFCESERTEIEDFKGFSPFNATFKCYECKTEFRT